MKDGCIAIACPITGDWVAMTNHTRRSQLPK
ncbi:MAG: hypothetical protein ACLRP3_03980 [Escherichia sp.]